MREAVSQTDHQQQKPVNADPPNRITNLKGSRYFPSQRSEVQRRVRFAEYNDEFLFVADPPTPRPRSRGRGGVALHPSSSESPEWVNAMEDVYYLFEDFMDDLGYSCAQALEKNRPKPSPKSATKASTAYYV